MIMEHMSLLEAICLFGIIAACFVALIGILAKRK